MESTIFGLDTTLFWTAFFVIGTFGLYIGIAIWARASTSPLLQASEHSILILPGWGMYHGSMTRKESGGSAARV